MRYRKERNIGRQRKRVKFYDRNKLEISKNEAGEYEQKPRLIKEAWAEIIPLRGKIFQEANMSINDETLRLLMRRYDEIKRNDCVVIDDNTYEVEFIDKAIRDMEVVVKWVETSNWK